MLRIYTKAFTTVLRSKLEYRFDFVVSCLGAVAQQLCALFFLAVVLEHAPELAGWSRYQVLLLFGMTGTALGLSELFFNHLWYLPRYVTSGELDRLLLYPVPSLPFLLVTSPELHAIGNAASGIGMTLYALSHLASPWWAYPLCLFWAGCGALIYTAVLVCLVCLSFIAVGPIYSVLYLGVHLLNASRYPLDVYPRVLRLILLVVVPFGAFHYLPVRWLFGGGSLALALAAPPLAVVACGVLATHVWRWGLARYEGAGS